MEVEYRVEVNFCVCKSIIVSKSSFAWMSILFGSRVV